MNPTIAGSVCGAVAVLCYLYFWHAPPGPATSEKPPAPVHLRREASGPLEDDHGTVISIIVDVKTGNRYLCATSFHGTALILMQETSK